MAGGVVVGGAVVEVGLTAVAMVVGVGATVGCGVAIGPEPAPQVRTAGPGAVYGFKPLFGFPSGP